jgi:peptidoglycan hydrolase CwlO-like protein
MTMSMVGTIEDMRWEIKQLKKENDLLSKQLRKKDKELSDLKNNIREFDDDERKRAMERYKANGVSTD